MLGHEIGHVTARHSVRQYTRTIGGVVAAGALGVFIPAARPFGQISEQALGLLFLKYGRDDELQADQLGARYEATGGWDPSGVPGMLATLGRLDEAAGERKGIPNWLSTHPEPLARVAEIAPTVTTLKTGRTDFVTNREALERRLDGVIFGDNPEQGVTRGSTFLHPPLRFRIDFPRSGTWPTVRSRSSRKRRTRMCSCCCRWSPKPQGQTVRDVALAHMQAAGLRRVQGERTTINGLDAFVGSYQGQIEGLGDVASRAAHIAHGGTYYMVAGLVAPAGFTQVDGAFTTAIRSFRALTAAEAEAIRPSRVDFYIVREGDTWASLAERSGGAIRPTTLAVMNHTAPDAAPRVGARIKIVVSG